jgi:hypothetical protein
MTDVGAQHYRASDNVPHGITVHTTPAPARRRRPAPAPVATTRVHPDVLATALRLADGDHARLSIDTRDGSVTVHNNNRGRP